MIEELDDKQEFEQEFELADMAADDDDSILSLLPQSRSSAPANSGFGLAGAQWRLEDAARSMSMAREQIRREAQEELERELELPPNWRERDRSRNLERWHQRMALRAKASGRPRCEHVYVDGTRCRAPRLDSGRLCYAHEEMEQVCPSRPSGPNAAARKVNLRPMEDGNSIMLNIMEINRALLEQEITEQQARILLSSQQMGLRALKGCDVQADRSGADGEGACGQDDGRKRFHRKGREARNGKPELHRRERRERGARKTIARRYTAGRYR
jgi:hypothetical protein